MHPARALFHALLLAAPAVHAASNCDAIREQIEAKLRAGGLKTFALEVVDADAPPRGKVLGSCERGTKRIVQLGSTTTANVAPAAPPKTPSREPILTECKDGRVSVGGDCRK